MNKRIVRILALVLCAVMILGMIPMIVNAEEIQPRSITEMDKYNYIIENFADLKEVVTKPADAWVSVYYEGADALVIEEDLTIPENMALYAWGAHLVVPEGVTFTTREVYSGSMHIQGQMTCACGSVDTELRVDGKLFIEDSMSIANFTKIIGMENISFRYDWGCFMIYYNIASGEELADIFQEAANAPDNMLYYVNIVSDTELPQSVTVPANVDDADVAYLLWHTLFPESYPIS